MPKFYIENINSWQFNKNYNGIYTRKFKPAIDDVYFPQMFGYSPSK